MSNTYRMLNAAHPKNLKPLTTRPRSNEHEKPIYPNNKVYLDSPQQQSTVKEFNRERVIEQNKKMKQQVIQLAKQMQEVVGSNRRKKKYGINLDEGMDAQTLRQKEESQRQEVRIGEMKKEIFDLKKENQYSYDESTVIEKQNAVRALQNQIKQLENQKAGLIKVKKQQEKGLNQIKNSDSYREKIEKSRSQLSKLREECKVLGIKTAQNEKLLLKTHEKIVGKNKKIKDVEDRIRQNKEKIRKGTQHVVTIEMISQIEQQILRLQSEFKDLEKAWHEKISNVEVQFSNRKTEEEKKLIILKDKEREAKLNEIRLKEFRKLIIQGRSEQKEENMKEFRNKRNIKYLEKSSS